MTHPSLVLWNGNNENIWGYVDWGWQRELDGRPWGAGFYFDLLPRVVAELDPGRPYWPGSPYSGSMTVAPNADAHGCVHVWDVWNRLDHDRYRDHAPRFVAEFGWQAPPTWATLRAAITDDPLHARRRRACSTTRRRTTATASSPRGLAAPLRRADRRRRLVVGHPAQPGPGRAHRRRALPVAARHVHGHDLVAAQRLLAGHQLGASSTRGGRPKPAWYALRDAYAPRLLTIQPRGIALGGVRRQRHRRALAPSRHGPPADVDGDVLADGDARPRRGRRGRVGWWELPAGGRHAGVARARELLLAVVGAAGVVVVRRRPRLRATRRPRRCRSSGPNRSPGRARLHVRAPTALVRDLALMADRSSRTRRSTAS